MVFLRSARRLNPDWKVHILNQEHACWRLRLGTDMFAGFGSQGLVARNVFEVVLEATEGWFEVEDGLSTFLRFDEYQSEVKLTTCSTRYFWGTDNRWHR